MTNSHIEDREQREIIDGVDVDHIDDRPDELEHVAIQEDADDDLRALPFNESRGVPPGYLEIDVDLMQYDDVCDYVEENTDYDRPINFARVPAWPPEGPTATDAVGRQW